MDQQQWQAKPLTATVLTFDGSFNDAKAVKDAVETATLSSVAVSPLPDGEHYALYVPGPNGSQFLSPGDVLVKREGDVFYAATTVDQLNTFYEEIDNAEAQGS